ncbi:MAG: hypothetical protein JXQ72_08550 [Anaerolineae bacterium]|nr:hypothetical protein [Anaerolineae bacterium]
MGALVISDDLAERLQALAQRENRSVDAVLSDLLDQYDRTDPLTDPLDAMDGMFGDDVTDLSVTVRSTMEAFYRDKYGRSD